VVAGDEEWFMPEAENRTEGEVLRLRQ